MKNPEWESVEQWECSLVGKYLEKKGLDLEASIMRPQDRSIDIPKAVTIYQLKSGRMVTAQPTLYRMAGTL